MRFRGQLSLLLAASLLAMSSWASACDLSCSLQKLHSGCPTNAPAEEKPAGIMPAGMSMGLENPKAITEGDLAPQAAMILLMDVSCTHERCSRTSISASAVSTDHGEFQSARMPAVSVTPLLPRLLQGFSIRTEASPPKIAAISPVSIHLRI